MTERHHDNDSPSQLAMIIGELKGTMTALNGTMHDMLSVQQEQTASISALQSDVAVIKSAVSAVESLASEQIRQAKDIARHENALRQAVDDIRSLQDFMMQARAEKTTALIRKSGDWKSMLFSQKWLPWFLAALISVVVIIAAFSYASGRNALDFLPIPCEEAAE